MRGSGWARTRRRRRSCRAHPKLGCLAVRADLSLSSCDDSWRSRRKARLPHVASREYGIMGAVAETNSPRITCSWRRRRLLCLTVDDAQGTLTVYSLLLLLSDIPREFSSTTGGAAIGTVMVHFVPYHARTRCIYHASLRVQESEMVSWQTVQEDHAGKLISPQYTRTCYWTASPFHVEAAHRPDESLWRKI